MKRQIRYNVFETNSSSVHSITICSSDEYSKWKKGELYKQWHENAFLTRDEIIENLKCETHWRTGKLIYKDVNWDDVEAVNKIIKDSEYDTEEEFWEDVGCEYETFYEPYTTPSGDKIVAFGYYGADR